MVQGNPRIKPPRPGSLAGMSRRAVDSLGETVASLPPRPANLVEPPELHPELASALSEMGVERLYSHQREAYERLRAGENVVVATATASGKSLCYKIPAFENALKSAARTSWGRYGPSGCAASTPRPTTAIRRRP
jgi:ATP-dependent helicase YprA (DUF1998 family)